MRPIQIKAVMFDEDHDVESVAIVLDAPYLAPLNEALGRPTDDRGLIVSSARGDTELHMVLDARQLLALHRVAGKWPMGATKIPGAYDAASLVIYRLMEDR